MGITIIIMIINIIIIIVIIISIIIIVASNLSFCHFVLLLLTLTAPKMMMMPLHCNTMTAKSIQIQSILCLFSTEEPCKDCLILTAIPCRVNPPSEQTQKILFNFFSKMAKRGMLHGTPKKFPKISKNFSRVPKTHWARNNWTIKSI